MPDDDTGAPADTPAARPDDEVTTGGCLLLVAVLLLGVGVLALAASAFFAHVGPSEPDPDTVRCGDEVMRRGDTCIAFGGVEGDGGDYADMAEQQADQGRTHRANHDRASTTFRVGGALLAIGVVLYVAATLTLTRRERRRERRSIP
jgi:hypothetical protein